MKTKGSLLVILATVLTVLCVGQTATEYENPAVNHLAGMLNCTCGGCRLRMDCVMPPTGICPICKAAKIRIARMKTEGRSDNQILDAFVAENGAVVLAVSPGPFGSAAPYLALAFGLAFVFWSIRRYRNLHPKPAIPAGDDAMLSLYHDQIEKDLSNLD